MISISGNRKVHRPSRMVCGLESKAARPSVACGSTAARRLAEGDAFPYAIPMHRPAPSAEFQLDFLAKVERILSQGQFTTTYKFALLIALTNISAIGCASSLSIATVLRLRLRYSLEMLGEPIDANAKALWEKVCQPTHHNLQYL